MKRKIKILILTISLIAMLCAFTITSSAMSRNLSDIYSDGDYWEIYDLDNGSKFYGLAYTGSNLQLDVIIDCFGILNDGVEGMIEDLENDPNDGRFFLEHRGDFSRFSRDEVLSAFKSEYAEFEALLEKEYTQYDLDIAVTEATKDMYTQEQLSEAVAKALKEGNLNPNNYLVYIPSDATIADVAEGTEESYLAQEVIEGSFSYFVVSLNGGHMERIFVANPFEFQAFCKMYNITDFQSLVTVTYEIQQSINCDDEYDAYDWLSSLYNMWSENVFDFFYNYDPLTQEEYEADIEASKLAGVEEFKASEEYTNILNNNYSTGYTEGIEAFKVSKAYTDALDLQYSNGKVAGVTEFKNSVSFANTLKAEYDEGYDAGVLDTQGVNTKNETTKLISILIGVIGFGILFTTVLSAVGAFKKKRAKRR